MKDGYLVDPSNQVVRMKLYNYKQLKDLFKRGYRRATGAERLKYEKDKRDKTLKYIEDAKLIDVFFLCPSKYNNDGYGTTRKLFKRYCEKDGVFLNEYDTGQKIGLCYNYPYALEGMKCEYKILFTMFESTRMPEDWRKYLKMADLVIVPSRFCANTIKKQFGIEAKIINLGYDAEVFNFILKDKHNEFTFLHYDAFKWRKGWDIVLQAFDDEFEKEKDVKLIMKTIAESTPPLGEYPKVKKIKADYTQKQLKNLMVDCDCFVFPSRGEGFGITPLEAMATGMPAIVPNAHGIADYYNWELMPNIEYFGIKAKYENKRFKGQDLGAMFQVRVESLRKAMREMYNLWKKKNWEERRIEVSEYAKKFTIQKTSKLLANEIKFCNKIMQQKRDNKIVFLTEDTRHITGGRYYSWWLATALKAGGYDVEIYTNRMPVFLKEFKDYPQPTVYIVDDIKTVNVNAQCYFGSPVVGNMRACQLAEKYGKEAYVEIFDPFPMMEKYREKHFYPEWDQLIPQMKKEFVNVIALCNETKKYIYPWLNKRKNQVFPVYPCINSREKRKAKNKKKKDWAVFVSRLDHHKNVDHVLEAIKGTDLELHVITSVDGINFEEMVREYEMEDQVIVHWFASDKEKFEIIKQSKIMINGATFEGFGMWLAEALSCGVPCVCYDYPTFREIAGEDNPLVKFAEWNNKEDLKKKLRSMITKVKVMEELKSDWLFTNEFDFKFMVERLKQIMDREPKIGVVTICLNEENYIKASILSVLNHPNIAKIGVVEGCVEQNEHSENNCGLSVDNTKREIKRAMLQDDKGKIVYDRYGWAGNKSELRNRALELVGKEMDYILVVDGDECWKHEDLDKLVKYIKKNPNASVIWPKGLHFWKQPNYLAVGGQWDAKLFRIFKYANKNLHWERHETQVVDNIGRFAGDLGDDADLREKINFYHYGYLKPAKRVAEKLKYYEKRDTNLKVENTFEGWRKGMPTQPTHGGGDVEEFKREHPDEAIEAIKKLCEK